MQDLLLKCHLKVSPGYKIKRKNKTKQSRSSHKVTRTSGWTDDEPAGFGPGTFSDHENGTDALAAGRIGRLEATVSSL